jgi:hypothetical protein
MGVGMSRNMSKLVGNGLRLDATTKDQDTPSSQDNTKAKKVRITMSAERRSQKKTIWLESVPNLWQRIKTPRESEPDRRQIELSIERYQVLDDPRPQPLVGDNGVKDNWLRPSLATKRALF